MNESIIRTSTFLLLTALLHGCSAGNQAAAPIDLNRFGTITEYENHYNASSQLERTVATEYQYMGRDTVFNGKQEHIYHYDRGNVTLKETFKLNSDSTKTLRSKVEYTGRQEVDISYRDGEQDSYSLVELDADGRCTRRVRKNMLIVPEFGMNINDDYEERMEYDAQGKPLYFIRYDMTTKQCVQTYYTSSHDAIITPRSPDRKPKELIVERITLIVTSHKDTTITHTYRNKQLERIEKSMLHDGRKIAFHYNGEGVLLSSDEEFEQNGMAVNVYWSSESNYTDSTFRKNNRILRSLSSDDESRRERNYQYDQHGNLTREVLVVSEHNIKPQ